MNADELRLFLLIFDCILIIGDVCQKDSSINRLIKSIDAIAQFNLSPTNRREVIIPI